MYSNMRTRHECGLEYTYTSSTQLLCMWRVVLTYTRMHVQMNACNHAHSCECMRIMYTVRVRTGYGAALHKTDTYVCVIFYSK